MGGYMSVKWSDRAGYRSSYEVLGYLLRLMSSIWHRQLNAELARVDLTEMQFVLLIGLGWLSESRQDGVSQKDLAQSCGCSTALASQVLKKLVQKKLVAVRNDERDARAQVVSLSEEGEAVLGHAVEILERTDKAFRSDDPSGVRRPLRRPSPGHRGEDACLGDAGARFRRHAAR